MIVLFWKKERVLTEVKKVVDSGLRLIAKEEGFSAYPYTDAKGKSVGFGHFILPTDQFSYPMDEETAYNLLRLDAKKASDTVDRLVKVSLTQNQKDVLDSLTYNIGITAFADSTLLKVLNSGDYIGAAKQLSAWRKSNGQIDPVLVARRERDRKLFLA